MNRAENKAFTIIELLVVVLILGMLSAIAVGVYTTQVERARYAAAKASISAIEVAINRYQIDLGTFPPSGSGAIVGGAAEGCGNLELALMHSVSGNSKRPASPSWHGPYLTVKNEMLGDRYGVTLEELTVRPAMGWTQILDPWHQPYRYVRFGSEPDSYESLTGTRLPANHPYAATETFYNPSTFQIVSKGANGETRGGGAYGLDGDDVTNFGM